MHDASTQTASNVTSAMATVESLMRQINVRHPGGITLASRMPDGDRRRRNELAPPAGDVPEVSRTICSASDLWRAGDRDWDSRDPPSREIAQ